MPEKTTKNKNEIIALSDSMDASMKGEMADLFSNIGEVGIDAALNAGILRDVPIISTAVSLFRIGNTMRERSLLEKMYYFVKGMNEGCEDEEEREKRAEYFKNNKKKRAEELKYLIILLDRYVSTERAEWLSKVYIAYLEKEITWNEVLIFSECIDKIITADLAVLKFYASLGEFPGYLSFSSSYTEKTRMICDYKYEEQLSRLSNQLGVVNALPERIKMHTDRLVSAGLITEVPIPDENDAFTIYLQYGLSSVGLEFLRIIGELGERDKMIRGFTIF